MGFWSTLREKIILDQWTQTLIGWISYKTRFYRTQYYREKYGIYITFKIIRSVNSKEGGTIFPKSSSNSIIKYEAWETTKTLIMLIHEDVLQILQQMSVLFCRALITSGIIIYSNFRKGNIELGLVTTWSQC